MTYRGFISAAVLSLALVPAPGVMAQDSSNLTPEEIAKIFDGQKTRSLVIAPGTDTGVETPAAADGTSPDTKTPSLAVGTEVAAADPNYTELDKDLQVNIQVRFDFDSATLKDSEKPKLAALCEAMKSVDVKVFQVIGHTDSSGTDAYNQRLSLRRAEAVKQYLVSDCGIDETRLEAVGVGEAHPYDAADPRADANRRVEFQVVS